MTLASVLVAAAVTVPPEVQAVRLTTIDFRPALRVLVSEGMPPATVVREGDDVVIRLPAVAPAGLVLPVVEPPLVDLSLERHPGETVLRLRTPPGQPFETGREPGMVTVVFGPAPSPTDRGPVTPDLYRLLFPTSVMETGTTGEEAEGTGPIDSGPEGIGVGRLRLRPYATVGYVDADVVTSESAEPTRARYLQVAPGVTATLPLMTGRFAAEYEPRFRFLSDIPEIGTTSHLAGARLDLPVGSRTLLRVGHRYTRAVLETTVVDPGREYFYDLSRYDYNNTTLAARIEVGPSLAVDLDASFSWTRFEEPSAGFFDYDSRTFRAGLGYDLGRDLRATVSYAYDQIPAPPDRSLVESSAHNVLGTLEGQVGALTSGTLTAGFRYQTNPRATAFSDGFTGLVLAGNLRRELGYRSVIGLQLRRATEPSAFEDNAYYVTNQVTASLDIPIPLGLWLRGSGGFLRNDYPTVSAGAGLARRDDLWLWTVGVGRQLGWRTWIRADYSRESRGSNLPGFDVTTDGFVFQFGVGHSPQGVAR